MTNSLRSLGVLVFLLVASTPSQEPPDLTRKDAGQDALWLESLGLSGMEQGWGQPRAGRSVDDHPITLRGRVFAHGIGTHANSEWSVDLKGVAVRFLAEVGIDDEVRGRGSVAFEVWVDGRKAAESGLLRGEEGSKPLSADLRGAQTLTLVVTDGGDTIDYDHADWAGALVILQPGATARPEARRPAEEPPPALARGTPDEPSINHPRITGATPGRPFLFRIPATGAGPLRFAATHLPEGLRLDPATGIITGALPTEGRAEVDVAVDGAKGRATARLTIVGGARSLARTPPMGWNSWNVWGTAVDDAKVRAAADAMVRSGLAAHGFQYLNIDDGWEKGRDAGGHILSNEKFPDLRALADYVHARGLKLGIYSSPGPKTCAGYEGSLGHEVDDARTWAGWGIDLIKYDWCSYGEIAKGQSREELMKPYRVMREALDLTGRDIVYSLCQYGMGDVWAWGAEVGGNYWRTTGDITDSWSSMAGIGFHQDGLEKHAGPGHWNDPDMLVVGKLGWGPNIRPTRLTPNEQLTHISLWCLLSAPLLLGCDLTQLDDFTLALLTNDEVLAVNQDPLGRPARRVVLSGVLEAWARPLADGTLAVGLFNRGREPARVEASWAALGLDGPQPVRNLWTRKDEGVFEKAFAAMVPRHGTVLLRVGTPGAGR